MEPTCRIGNSTYIEQKSNELFPSQIRRDDASGHDADLQLAALRCEGSHPTLPSRGGLKIGRTYIEGTLSH